jgi:hypothetical protein
MSMREDLENSWWDKYCSDKAIAEDMAMQSAIDSADLWEFDSEEERIAYIEEVYEDRLAELLGN